MRWPPRIGAPLPRASSVWYEKVKLNWILGEDGHESEWRRIFHIEASDADRVWDCIAEVVPMTPVMESHGEGIATSYGVLVDVTINGRSAPVLTAWHYAHEDAAPRLVTAYPKPYTRRNGNNG